MPRDTVRASGMFRAPTKREEEQVPEDTPVVGGSVQALNFCGFLEGSTLLRLAITLLPPDPDYPRLPPVTWALTLTAAAHFHCNLVLLLLPITLAAATYHSTCCCYCTYACCFQ